MQLLREWLLEGKHPNNFVNESFASSTLTELYASSDAAGKKIITDHANWSNTDGAALSLITDDMLVSVNRGDKVPANTETIWVYNNNVIAKTATDVRGRERKIVGNPDTATIGYYYKLSNVKSRGTVRPATVATEQLPISARLAAFKANKPAVPVVTAEPAFTKYGFEVSHTVAHFNNEPIPESYTPTWLWQPSGSKLTVACYVSDIDVKIVSITSRDTQNLLAFAKKYKLGRKITRFASGGVNVACNTRNYPVATDKFWSDLAMVATGEFVYTDGNSKYIAD